MKLIENNFHRSHLKIFLLLWVSFSVFTYLAADAGIDDRASHARLLFLTTAATILGPLTGAVARDWQSCCAHFSLALLPFCGAFLLAGALAQWVKLPFKKHAAGLRLLAWVLGLLGWFLGGPISFLHAFS